jgi:hypothetical protein
VQNLLISLWIVESLINTYKWFCQPKCSQSKPNNFILPYININHLNIILNSTLHNSFINKYLYQNSITIYNQDSSTSIYHYNSQSKYLTNSFTYILMHIFNINSLTYIIFTTQISCILQCQFIYIFYFSQYNS